MASDDPFHGSTNWLKEDDELIGQPDGFAKLPRDSFPPPPLTPSTPALPTSFWVALIGIFAQIICVMMFGGSSSITALVASTLICTTIILGGTLDCLMNSPMAFKTTGMGLTFKILGLCVAVGTVVCGAMFFGWLFFVQDVNIEYRIDYSRPVPMSESIRSGRLANGLKYYIKSNGFEQGLFSTVLAVDSGSTNEDDNQQGLAHFLEHMAFDKSFLFPRRGQVYSEILKFGADFNAFTSFRNTVYFFHKLGWSTDNLKKALFLHKNQVLYQDPSEVDIDQERGAVLGEARLHNHTSRWASRDMICNHFGSDFQPCARFPIGLPEQIAVFRPTDFRSYLTHWYRLDRMRLYVVGDFDGRMDQVERAIKEQFQNEQYLTGQDPKAPPKNVPLKPTTPITPGRIFLHEYEGLSGVDMHLIVTSDYTTPMSSLLTIRTDTYNDVFESVFKTQVLSRFATMYPEQLLQGTGITRASVSVELDWNFNCTMYSLSISTAGKPHRSTWKRDLEVAVTELRLLAENGPAEDVILNAMGDVESDLESDEARQQQQPHEDLIMDLMGNLDPNFRYVDHATEKQIVKNFLSPTLVKAVSLHVQTCAQILYKALLETTANTTYSLPPYNSLPKMRSSFNIFHGHTSTKAFLKRITRDNIARVIAGVVSKPLTPVSPNGLTVMFMIPFLARRTSNTAQDLRESDFLLSFPQDDKFPESGNFKLVDYNNNTNIHRYMLSNGIGVNIRPTPSDEQGAPGVVTMQAVALGGLSTQTPSLKGACQFINTVKANGLSLAKAKAKDDSDNTGHYSHVFESTRERPVQWDDVVSQGLGRALEKRLRAGSGVHDPDTTRDPEDKQKEPKSSSEGLGCEGEFLKITVKLSRRCEEECDLATKDYTSNLLFALDEMRPQYDERTVKLAYYEHENQLDELELDLRANDVMSRTIVPTLISSQFAGDSRAQPVSLLDLKQLDPLEVNRWVREHFVPGRFEINIAGDLHLENTLRQLDNVFGTLPLVNFSSIIEEDNITAGVLHRVGLDPYDKSDTLSWARQWPNNKLRASCVLRSPTPDYAHIMHRFPAGDHLSSGTRPIIRKLADRVLQRMLFISIRRNNGMAYHVDLVPRHSVMFPSYGFFDLEWVAGRYSTYQNVPQFRPDLNILTSSTVAHETFTTEVSDDVFLEVVNTMVQRINASYADPEYWVRIMQGLSIRPPSTWPAPQADSVLPGLQTVYDTDELAELGAVSASDITAYLKTFSWNPSKYLFGIVTTRSHEYTLQSGEQECALPTNVV